MCVALAMREYRACGSPGDRCAQLRGKQFRCEVELEVALAMREYRACGSPGDRCAQLRGKQFRCEVELEVGSTELRDGLNEMR
uniref:GDNF domain-containing protein n=1 Tax=Ascaris lumbricoides TaxID=6252 RepID=A0A0M3I9Q3_ASCLU